MTDSLIHVVFLGIEIEIFILLLILIRKVILNQKKGKHHPSKSNSPKDTARRRNTSANSTADAEQVERLSYPVAAPSEPDLTWKAADMPVTPDILPDTFPQNDHRSLPCREDVHSKVTRIGVKEQLSCGVRNIQGVNSYSSQVQVVEEEQGALIVEIFENGSIMASPSNDITNERRLNEVFRPLFDFDMPEQPDEKKFKITCETEAELKRDGQVFYLKFKGRLNVEVA